jgi:hypothetical protein
MLCRMFIQLRKTEGKIYYQDTSAQQSQPMAKDKGKGSKSYDEKFFKRFCMNGNYTLGSI